MDEMQANCPPEPEGVNAFKITHTFLSEMRPPLQGLPRTSRWLLIQVRPPKPSCLLSTMAGLYCLCTQTTTAFCFPFSRKKIYVLAIFLSYEIDSFLAFTAMLQWLFTNGGIHTCHGHQALFFFFFARTCPVSAHREKGLESRCELNSELIIGFSLATATLDKRSTKTFSNYAIGTISKEDREIPKAKIFQILWERSGGHPVGQLSAANTHT